MSLCLDEMELVNRRCWACCQVRPDITSPAPPGESQQVYPSRGWQCQIPQPHPFTDFALSPECVFFLFLRDEPGIIDLGRRRRVGAAFRRRREKRRRAFAPRALRRRRRPADRRFHRPAHAPGAPLPARAAQGLCLHASGRGGGRGGGGGRSRAAALDAAAQGREAVGGQPEEADARHCAARPAVVRALGLGFVGEPCFGWRTKTNSAPPP